MSATGSPSSPPMIYASFLRANRWKNWVIIGQFALCGFLALCVLALGRREPDVVLVDSSSGESHYLNRSMAGESLLHFLAEQRQRPSDATVMHFTRAFVQLVLGTNAHTIESTWAEALSLMAPKLRDELARQAAAAHFIETERAAGTQATLDLDDVSVMERTPELFHLKVRLTRHRESRLTNGVIQEEPLTVELVERIVPRSFSRPDGLEVALWDVQSAPPSSPTPSNGGAHAP